jgi:hypothetical protein
LFCHESCLVGRLRIPFYAILAQLCRRYALPVIHTYAAGAIF